MKARVAWWWLFGAGAAGLVAGWALTSAFQATWFWPKDAWSGIGSTVLAAVLTFGAAVLVFLMTRSSDRKDAQDLRELEAINEICRATLNLLDKLPNDLRLQRPGDWHGDWEDIVVLRGSAVESENAAALVEQLDDMFVGYRKRWLELSMARGKDLEHDPKRPYSAEEMEHMSKVMDAYWEGLIGVTEELNRWSPLSKDIEPYVDVGVALYDAWWPGADVKQ